MFVEAVGEAVSTQLRAKCVSFDLPARLERLKQLAFVGRLRRAIEAQLLGARKGLTRK